jgi:hypothetical protein
MFAHEDCGAGVFIEIRTGVLRGASCSACGKSLTVNEAPRSVPVYLLSSEEFAQAVSITSPGFSKSAKRRLRAVTNDTYKAYRRVLVSLLLETLTSPIAAEWPVWFRSLDRELDRRQGQRRRRRR